MKKWILLTQIFAVSWVYSGDNKLYMPYFETINADANYQYSVTRLFKSYIEEYGNYVVTLPKKSNKIWELPTKEEIQKEANKQYCGFYLIGEINKIGEKIIIALALYNAHDGEHIWGDRQKINIDEDIDLVLEKLAKGMASGEKADEKSDIYLVTAQEQKKLRKINVRKSMGLSIGGAFLLPEVYEVKQFLSGAGVFWLYDARVMLYEIIANWYSMSDPLVSLSIGMTYPFFPISNSPFIDGGMGLSFTATNYGNNNSFSGPPEDEDFSGRGLMSYVGLGYLIGRTSTVGLRVKTRYFFGFYKLTDSNDTYPQGIMFNLDLYFGR